MLWSQRTWMELSADLEQAGRSAILPVGATEQHGPHLGCGMDAVLADRLCTHVTNGAPLRCALEMLRAEHDDMMVALFNSATLSPRVRAMHFADGEDWHANDAETSLMMAIAPELVRADPAATADDPDLTAGLVFAHPVNRTSRNGVTGAPSRASADNGRQWFDWMVEDLSELIRRGMTETPPLDHSYFTRAG
jgi:creatinine amidohydrolase